MEFTDEYYLNAFYTLSNSRSTGMSIGMIPFSEIIAYCEFYQESDPEFFVEVIQKVDNAFIKLQNTENPEVKKEK